MRVELIGPMNDHPLGHALDRDAALVHEALDRDTCSLERRFRKIGRRRQLVREGAPASERMISGEQCPAITAQIGVAVAVVQDRGAVDLLGVLHGAGQRPAVPRPQTAVETIFFSLFGDRERQRHRVVGVAGGPDFFRVVVSDSGAFLLDGGRAKTRIQHVVFVCFYRVFGLEYLPIFFRIALVLDPKHRVEAELELLCEIVLLS